MLRLTFQIFLSGFTLLTGQKGETGENSTAQIAILEDAVTDIQQNITGIFGKINSFSPVIICGKKKDDFGYDKVWFVDIF